MSWSTDLWYVCFIFSAAVENVVSDYTTAGYDRNNESAIVTECVTPNRDVGLCIGIKQCSILIKQVGKKNTEDFLLASQCGYSKDVSNVKVCCGKYDNFITRAKIDKIFPKTCGRQDVVMKSRIVGGKEAGLGEFPWLVRLLYRAKGGQRSFGCSGALISYKFVLTAAHCTHPGNIGDRKVISVILGEHNTETDPDCSTDGQICNHKRTRKVIKVINHPGYNPESRGYYSDVAILQLRKAVKRPNYVRPICILRKNNKVPTKYYVSGWGKTEKELYSKVKLKVDLPVFDMTKCRERYASRSVAIKDTQICVGGEKGKDSCVGDSGGPLMMVDDDDETWYLSGIVSFGSLDCGSSDLPGVYTNITQFLPWIQSEIERNLPSMSTKQEKKPQTNVKGLGGKKETSLPNVKGLGDKKETLKINVGSKKETD